MYLDLLKYKHMAHTAVRENDLEMIIYTWESMLPFCFYFKKINYTQYWICYVQQLNHLETLYPGFKSLLEAKGVSLPTQSFHHVRKLKLRVSHPVLRNVWKIGIFKLPTASVFHWETLLDWHDFTSCQI